MLILHLNIVSLVANFDSVLSLISQTKVSPHFICISETRLKDKKIDWQSALVKIPNYELHYDNSKLVQGVSQSMFMKVLQILKSSPK